MRARVKLLLIALMLAACSQNESAPYRFSLDSFTIDRAPERAGDEIAFEMRGNFVRGEVYQGETIVYRFVGQLEQQAIRLPDGTSLSASQYQRFRAISRETPRLRVHGGDEGQVAELMATVGALKPDSPADPLAAIPCSTPSGEAKQLVIRNTSEGLAFSVVEKNAECKLAQHGSLRLPGTVVTIDSHVGASWFLRDPDKKVFRSFVLRAEDPSPYVVEVTSFDAEE